MGALSSVPLQGGAGTAAEPQESSKGLTQDCWLQGHRMTDFGQKEVFPWPQPNPVTSGLSSQSVGIMVPLHLGYDSGKQFTKASKDNCLPFVSHLVWAPDVSD